MDEAIKIDPHRSDAYWHRARCKILLGEIEAADSDLENVLRLDPEHIAALIAHESICHDKGIDAGASISSIKDLALESGGWKKDWLQAQLAYQAWSYSQASRKFRDALKAINGKEPYIGWTLETRHARSM